MADGDALVVAEVDGDALDADDLQWTFLEDGFSLAVLGEEAVLGVPVRPAAGGGATFLVPYESSTVGDVVHIEASTLGNEEPFVVAARMVDLDPGVARTAELWDGFANVTTFNGGTPTEGSVRSAVAAWEAGLLGFVSAAEGGDTSAGSASAGGRASGRGRRGRPPDRGRGRGAARGSGVADPPPG